MKKSILMFLMIMFAMISCNNVEDVKADKYSEFWIYFKSVESKLENITHLSEVEQTSLLNEVKQQLEVINPNLNIQFSDKNKELFITAGGIRESFSDVERLVSKAPKDLGWTITAFKQRAKLPVSYIFDDSFSLSSDEIFFKTNEVNNQLDLEVYFDGQEALQEIQKKQVIYIFLDEILGEYDTERYIGMIYIAASKNKEALNAAGLREVVDDFKKQKK